VDDEPAILRSLQFMLDDHFVLTAHGAAEALRLVEEEELDVIVCDLAMPGMNGIELVRRLHDVKPRLASRVIFMTGNMTAWAGELACVPHVGCLEKPFGEQAVRTLLERAVASPSRPAQSVPSPDP
jgi:CheY-like chemotaxis protein